MIPQRYILEWAERAPWQLPWQIEQDLIITTTLLKIYENSELKKTLAFRGGTALNKLFLKSNSRYSEDIDLVQINAGPIKNTVQILQQILEPWLGKCDVKQSKINTTLTFKQIISEDNIPLRLKIEIHTREHFSLLGYQEFELISDSSYNSGKVFVTTYKLEELLGTKIRCLSQRRYGRDLYDLYISTILFPNLNHDEIIHCFKEYMLRGGNAISKSQFLKRMDEHLKSHDFINDTKVLISNLKGSFNSHLAYEHLLKILFHKL